MRSKNFILQLFFRKWLVLCYVMPIIEYKRAKSERSFYSFLFLKLLLEFGLDFEFGLD